MRLLAPDQLDDPVLATREPAALRFVRDCIEAPGIDAIHNIETRMKLLDTGSYLFPVSVNSSGERPDNCYVVSPLTTYTHYASYELSRLKRPLLAWPLARLVSGFGRQLEAARIDRLVQVNNWLLATNIYPPGWAGKDLPEITRSLVDNFPDHAIGFRSLNRFSNTALLDHLQSLGYMSIPSRQVYLFDGRTGDRADFLRRHNTCIDATLLRRTPYRIVPGRELNNSDFSRLEQLYNQLYLEKYSPLNPQFSADWLRCGQRDGWLELRALRTEEGRIDGVLGWFSNAEIMTAPIIGYDTALPQRLGLYRLLTGMCLQETVQRRSVLNFSSGAAHFKRLRGGQPEIEYSMVYVRHLPTSRRRVWRMLSQMLHAVGVPLMKAYKL